MTSIKIAKKIISNDNVLYQNEKKLNEIEEYYSEDSTKNDDKDSFYEEDLFLDKKSLIINNILNVLQLIIKDSEELEEPNIESMNKFQIQFYEAFNSKRIPKISLKDYLIRILKHSEIEINTLISSLIYLDYLCTKNFIISKYNVHKLLFISILISSKYNEDVIYDNETYSKIAGLKIDDVNKMENIFFKACDHNLFIKEETFYKYKDILENNICLVS